MKKDGKETLIADAPGLRLDRFLALRLTGLSRSHLKGLVEQGLVTVDGRPEPADYRLKGEERIEVEFRRPAWTMGGDFEDWVLHEDSALLVLNKPAGLLMHPLGSSWLKTPEAALSEPEANLAGLLQSKRPGLLKAGVSRCGIVHRLDRQTSGVLLVAKTRAAQEALLEAFKERKVRKLYRAIVRGVPEAKSRVDAPVGRQGRHRRVVVTPFGKSAQTGFRVLDSCPGAALVEATPLTGRTHQIRAHLAYLGHPVAGDAEFDAPKSDLAPSRMLLHAYKIEFAHPATGREAAFTAPVPRDFKEFWARCAKGA